MTSTMHLLDFFQSKTRIVLGDWYTQGSVLVFTPQSFELQNREFSNSFQHPS